MDEYMELSKAFQSAGNLTILLTLDMDQGTGIQGIHRSTGSPYQGSPGSPYQGIKDSREGPGKVRMEESRASILIQIK